VKRADEEWFVIDVVYINATRGEKLWVFFSKNTVSKNASSHNYSYRFVSRQVRG
jgi:hypothetical protein